MFKKSIRFSVAATAALFILGCGSNDTLSNETTTLPSVSNEVKILAQSISMQGMLGSLVQIAMPDLSDSRSRIADIANCTNGGTFTIENNLDPQTMQNPNFDFTNFTIDMTMDYDNCLMDGDVTDGTIASTITINGDAINFSMSYQTDFIFKSDEGEFKILKDSTLQENNAIMTESMTIIYDGQTYQSEDLKIAHAFTNNKFYTYPISGKQTIGDVSYTVDSTYDASKTPMVTDDEGNIDKGGKSKYINNQNHHITIEAIDTNKMQVSVDTDGDGKDDQSEIISF